MMNEPLTAVEPAIQMTVNRCEHNHIWQPTIIIIGYFRCSRCHILWRTRCKTL